MSFWLQNNHIDISDKTVEKGSIKTIDYREVTDELISSVASDEKIQYIQVSKELPEKAYQVIDKFLEAKPGMTFRIWGLYGIKHYDISYLHKMPHLRHLIISCHLSSNPGLIDFDLIKGLPLKSLGLDAFDLKDYSFIKDLPKDIERLEIMADAKTRNVKFDCEWLLKYKNLTELFLGGKARKNITCLGELKCLKSLSIRGITLEDFSFLKDVGLETLNIYWNNNYDLSGVGELTTLKEIYLWRINRLSDVSFLEKLTSLESIRLEYLCHVTSLPDLSKHKNLKEIILDNTAVKPEEIDERIRPIVKIQGTKRPVSKPVKKEPKKKTIYTARIKVDDELLNNLGPDRTGCMENWFLMSQGASFSIYLFVPDLNTTDTFSFDVLFDDEFRKYNDVKVGDHFPVSIPFPTILRQIEIIGITEGEPINTLENKRPVKQSDKTVAGHLEWYLYHHLETDECRCDDGWFNTENILEHLERMGSLSSLQQLGSIVNNDEDHRYILSDDKTKIRTSPEHPAPKYVEQALENAGELKIKKIVFVLNKLPFKKDKKRSIHVECSNGDSFDFPYQTNKIFFMDRKHFFMVIESHDDPMLAVSSYMTRDGTYHYRMAIEGFPRAINNLFADYADLLDYDGNVYRVNFK